MRDFFTFKSTLKMEKRHQLHFLALIGKNGGLAKHVLIQTNGTDPLILGHTVPWFWGPAYRQIFQEPIFWWFLMKIFDHFWWFLHASMWKWWKLMKIFDHFWNSENDHFDEILKIIIFDEIWKSSFLMISENHHFWWNSENHHFWWFYEKCFVFWSFFDQPICFDFWWKYLIIFDENIWSFLMMISICDENLMIFDENIWSFFDQPIWDFWWKYLIILKANFLFENLMKFWWKMMNWWFLCVNSGIDAKMAPPKNGQIFKVVFTRNTQPKMTKIGHFL